MALVTDYGTLKAHIADTLNRSDLTSVIPNFIQQFEAYAKTDGRLRKLTNVSSVGISTDAHAMPSDMYRLESWYHNGTTYYGPIQIVNADEIGRLKGAYGNSGVPQFAAIVDNVARFAPVPDATYSTVMTYWRKIISLSDTNTTNWLLISHPDIYLYGSLAESAPYLKDDNRTTLWKSLLDERLEQLSIATSDAAFGGSINRNFTPIGG
jgi:hypothetical protein